MKRIVSILFVVVLALFASAAMAQQACRPADARTVAAAKSKLDAAERKLLQAKTPGDNARAQKEVDAAKAEVARLTCSESGPSGSSGQCVRADPKAIAAAKSKLNAAELKLARAKLPGDKARAQKEVDAAKAELAKLECQP